MALLDRNVRSERNLNQPRCEIRVKRLHCEARCCHSKLPSQLTHHLHPLVPRDGTLSPFFQGRRDDKLEPFSLTQPVKGAARWTVQIARGPYDTVPCAYTHARPDSGHHHVEASGVLSLDWAEGLARIADGESNGKLDQGNRSSAADGMKTICDRTESSGTSNQTQPRAVCPDVSSRAFSGVSLPKTRPAVYSYPSSSRMRTLATASVKGNSLALTTSSSILMYREVGTGVLGCSNRP